MSLAAAVLAGFSVRRFQRLALQASCYEELPPRTTGHRQLSERGSAPMEMISGVVAGYPAALPRSERLTIGR